MSFWGDVWHYLNINTYNSNTVGSAVSGAASGANSTLSDLDKLTGVLGTFFSDLTDAAIWRSLAWMALGLLLFGLGLLLLLRRPIEDAVRTTVQAVKP